MKTSILALATALAFSFTPTPAAAGPTKQYRCERGKLAAAAKHVACRVRAERSFYLSSRPEALARKLANCDSALESAYAKREAAIPQECSDYGDVQNVKELNTAVATCLKDGSASASGVDCLSTVNDDSVCQAAGGTWENDDCTAADITSNDAAIAAAAAQAACDDANGTWDGSVCTPAARDCFREGACGVNGWNFGSYAGGNLVSSGCGDTNAGYLSYIRGKDFSRQPYHSFLDRPSAWPSFLWPLPAGLSFYVCHS